METDDMVLPVIDLCDEISYWMIDSTEIVHCKHVATHLIFNQKNYNWWLFQFIASILRDNDIQELSEQ